VAAAGLSGLPRWDKLSPNAPDLTDIAAAALEAGAEALVLVNTMPGMSIDPGRRTYRLGSGAGGGGLSGPAIRPVAVRAVHDCRASFPDAGIVGVGGVCRGVDAVEMMLAGADAVEVGTATFRDPRAPVKVLNGLGRWCRWHHVDSVRSLVGAVHGAATDAGAPATRVADMLAQARTAMDNAQFQVRRLTAEVERQVPGPDAGPDARTDPPAPTAGSPRVGDEPAARRPSPTEEPPPSGGPLFSGGPAVPEGPAVSRGPAVPDRLLDGGGGRGGP
jgi:hypothetical protein